MLTASTRVHLRFCILQWAFRYEWMHFLLFLLFGSELPLLSAPAKMNGHRLGMPDYVWVNHGWCWFWLWCGICMTGSWFSISFWCWDGLSGCRLHSLQSYLFQPYAAGLLVFYTAQLPKLLFMQSFKQFHAHLKFDRHKDIPFIVKYTTKTKMSARNNKVSNWC